MLLFAAAAALPAQKVDTITFTNGDRVTGEIKSLERGKLSYATTALGTVNVKWVHVRRVESPRFFEVTDASGRRHYGALSSPDTGQVAVHVGQFADTVPLAQVVEIAPIGAGLVQRLDGYVDVGYTFAKANRNQQLSFGAEVKYRPRLWRVRVTTSYYYQDQDPGSPTNRGSVDAQGLYNLGRQWAVGGSGGVETNEQTGLDLRSTIGAGTGLRLMRSNEVEAAAFAGLNFSAEDFAGAAPAQTLEAAIGVEGDVFRFGDHELDGAVRASAYPSLTDWGRIRSQADARVTYEVIRDFTVGLTFYHTYDSRPPGGTGAVTDYSGSFTVGWKF